ncbi:sensor histidine kinase [Profundibacterium mesophilum]|uniref:histidine kinase n=1 Tax=Profundibacterium mesophilum KAUST100406-0324 TaxID=1037889 RepID=A0A921TBL6_9RHOB|nr:HAMP domain-containing sensor histidine kinase [Profundibacterium mesophilum]KAF0675855.1 two-component system cell cycle sensor histidine kinase PleC [Profundibacterium mesophilum KAUST100406-0324]
MKIYEYMAKRNWPHSYSGKILLVSFIGVHVPMFGAVAYALLADATPFTEQLDVLAAMLVATLVGTGGTMFVMNALLAPVVAATQAADGYLREGRTPRLPTTYTDSAGVLMSSVQECITRLDSSLTTSELARKQIAHEHSSKFQILAGMKHDFRTPLTRILGFAELMKSEAIGPVGDDSYRRFAATIGDSGRELLQTLQSVLDLSDAQARSQLAEDSEVFDLADMAQEAISLEHLHAQKRGVSIELIAPPVLEVCTIPSAAKNILSALLQAAIDRNVRGAQVRMELDGERGLACISVLAVGGQLTLEDVPSELQHFCDNLPSGTGSRSSRPETSTPMTLRMSLLETLTRAIGAEFTLGQDARGWEMQVLIRPQPLIVPLAAE